MYYSVFIYIFNLFCFKDFIYLFLDRGKWREKNVHVLLLLACPPLGTWPATQACALTGNQSSDSLLRRLVLNPLSHTSQGFKSYFCSGYVLNLF